MKKKERKTAFPMFENTIFATPNRRSMDVFDKSDRKKQASDKLLHAELSMFPNSGHGLLYNDSLLIDDNLSDEHALVSTYGAYKGAPIKMSMTVVALLRQGAVSLHLNLQEFTVRAGQAIIIPPGTIISSASHTSDWRMAFFAIEEYNHPFLKGNNLISDYSKEVMGESLVMEVPEDIMCPLLDTFMLLRRAIQQRGRHYNAIVEDYLSAMGHWLLEAVELHDGSKAPSNVNRKERVFQQFLQDVQKHYSHERSVQYYAALACLTPKYLGQIIKECSGRRAIDWIDDMVILDAKAMILSGKYSIQEISEKLHFASPSFFGRYFREHVGCSPGKYKL